MIVKKIQGFHWLTKAVIVLTAFVCVWIAVASAADMNKLEYYGKLPPGFMLLYYLFVTASCVLMIVAIAIIVTGISNRITGVIYPGDTQDFKNWIEKLMGASAERKAEISDLKSEICQIRQSIESMQKKLDNIERILEKVGE
jgi:uncharacterized membrane protein